VTSRSKRLLPIPGSPSIRPRVPGAGGEPRDESDEQAILVTATDEGRGIARSANGRIGQVKNRCGGYGSARAGTDRREVQLQMARGVQRTCRIEEIAPLHLGYGERRGEPFSEPP